MKEPRSDLVRRILLTIDQNPSSIYDIQYSLLDASDPTRNRLPKLLKAMEDENLVRSALQPGPLGPYRRMYELGPKAQEYLNENLRDGIQTLLHFYRVFRRENPGRLYNLNKRPEQLQASGVILFASFPNLAIDDLRTIRELLTTSEGVSVAVVGSDDILTKTGILYQHMGMRITSIDAPNESVSEIHLHGIPPPNELSPAIEECKRVLTRNGLLQITAPFVFFKESNSPELENFIKRTAASLFPELGVIDGNSVRDIIETEFPTNGAYEAQQGEVVFWGVKS